LAREVSPQVLLVAMACPVSGQHHDVPMFPSILGPDEPCEEHPFARPENREIDLKYMHLHLPRALAVLVTLINQHKRRKATEKIFFEFGDVKGEGCSMRFLVPSMERLMAQSKFFVIGFFGFTIESSPVIKQIWDLDDKLVDAIPTFEGILGYHFVI
jgi:hypothetical protein